MFFLTLFSIFHQKLEQTCHFWKNNLASNFCQNSFSLRPRAPSSQKYPCPAPLLAPGDPRAPSAGLFLYLGCLSATPKAQKAEAHGCSLMHGGEKKKKKYIQVSDGSQ